MLQLKHVRKIKLRLLLVGKKKPERSLALQIPMETVIASSTSAAQTYVSSLTKTKRKERKKMSLSSIAIYIGNYPVYIPKDYI